MRNPLIAEAIAKKRLLEFQYNGFARVVQPHAYGVDKNRSEKLRCWQVSGGSASGKTEGWKLMDVSDIRATTMSEQMFSSPQTGYKRGDSAMRRIYAQL